MNLLLQSIISRYNSLDYQQMDNVDSKYEKIDNSKSQKEVFHVYYYGGKFIGQEESVLELSEDFELISEEE